MAAAGKRPVAIAIDGPAASGKGTLARYIAAELDLHYLDTGSLYREVALQATRLGIDLDDESALAGVAAGLRPGLVDQNLIRTPKITQLASRIAAKPAVRQQLLEVQRAFARRGNGAVLDGRDIGTVVLPDADVKLFISASPEVRARRRYLELKELGVETTEQDVFEDIRARDERDSRRAIAPLAAAGDAVHIDTSQMSAQEVAAEAMRVIAERISAG